MDVSELTPNLARTVRTVEGYEAAVDASVISLSDADRELVLFCGTHEEQGEFEQTLISAKLGRLDRDALVSELGDLLWYATVTAHRQGWGLSDVATEPGTITDPAWRLDDLQRHLVADQKLVDAEDFAEMPYPPEPASPELYDYTIRRSAPASQGVKSWHAAIASPVASTRQSLRETLWAISNVADLYGIDLSEIAQANLDKVANRDRLPHVLESVLSASA